MTDVADRHWGTSLVRAPTAKDAAHPDGTAAGDVEAVPRPTLFRRGPALLRLGRNGGSPHEVTAPPSPDLWEQIVLGRTPALAPVPAPVPPALAPVASAVAPMAPSVAAAPAPAPGPARAPAAPPRRVVAAAAVPSPAATVPSRQPEPPTTDATVVVHRPRSTPATPAAEPAPDPSLARLARGVQDCARALASLADRIDVLERRLGSVASDPAPRGPAAGLTSPAIENLGNRLGALEGLSSDRFQLLEQRLRRLEALPDAIVRLQQDTAVLADRARSRRPGGEGGPVDLEPVYQELDSVVEVVSAHHVAASQSLDRVRTLERAVLEMRRHLERNLAEHDRAALSEQTATRMRIDAIESRLRSAGSTPRIPST